MEQKKNYIYIMTNPAFPNLIKIGYATDPEQRRAELSAPSGVPADYEIYATSEVPSKLKDKKIHDIIQQLNPNLRFNPKREFFMMTPEDAFKLLKAIAAIYGKEELVIKYDDSDDPGDSTIKKLPPFRFSMCGINKDDYVIYTNDKSIKVKVLDEKHVEYNGSSWSLSALASELLFGEKKPIQGPLYFEYNGKTLDAIRREKGF